eukprot:2708482-Amphidinium_carterae.1
MSCAKSDRENKLCLTAQQRNKHTKAVRSDGCNQERLQNMNRYDKSRLSNSKSLDACVSAWLPQENVQLLLCNRANTAAADKTILRAAQLPSRVSLEPIHIEFPWNGVSRQNANECSLHKVHSNNAYKSNTQNCPGQSQPTSKP